MGISAIFFDLGGVILRTEYQAPREHLAERLNLSYEDLVRIVFDSESAQRASVGAISVTEHWEAVARRLRLEPSAIASLRDEFFGGDVLDRELVSHIRALKLKVRTGLISNAWSDGRQFITSHQLEDVFDVIVLSAEVGLVKPDPRIYEAALKQAGVAAASTVFVDDAPPNVEAASALGMHAILFRDPKVLVRELDGYLRGVQ